MQKRKFFIAHKKFFTSLRHARRGLVIALREEQNIRIHVFCALAVVFFAVLTGVDGGEFIVLMVSMTLVIAMELFNSSIERFSDIVKPHISHLIAAVKDISAAAVFVCALNACIVGAVIFFPKIFRIIHAVLF